jgi:hypothetical protein
MGTVAASADSPQVLTESEGWVVNMCIVELDSVEGTNGDWGGKKGKMC